MEASQEVGKGKLRAEVARLLGCTAGSSPPAFFASTGGVRRERIRVHESHAPLAADPAVFFAGAHQSSAQGTAFTYNGKLNDSGSPGNGSTI